MPIINAINKFIELNWTKSTTCKGSHNVG